MWRLTSPGSRGGAVACSATPSAPPNVRSGRVRPAFVCVCLDVPLSAYQYPSHTTSTFLTPEDNVIYQTKTILRQTISSMISVRSLSPFHRHSRFKGRFNHSAAATAIGQRRPHSCLANSQRLCYENVDGKPRLQLSGCLTLEE